MTKSTLINKKTGFKLDADVVYVDDVYISANIEGTSGTNTFLAADWDVTEKFVLPENYWAVILGVDEYGSNFGYMLTDGDMWVSEDGGFYEFDEIEEELEKYKKVTVAFEGVE